MTQANPWYNPNAMYQQQEQKLNTGVFTTFVDNEATVQNYPVPTGSMAIKSWEDVVQECQQQWTLRAYQNL